MSNKIAQLYRYFIFFIPEKALDEAVAWRASEVQDLTVIWHCRGISDIEINSLMVYEQNRGAIGVAHINFTDAFS